MARHVLSARTSAARTPAGARVFAGALAGALVAALAGCAASNLFDRAGTADDRAALLRLTVLSSPPEISAADAAEIASASAGLSGERLDELRARADAEQVRGAQTPLFFEAPFGRAFLVAPTSRALALGAPAETCAGIGSAAGAPTPAAAATAALETCLADRSAAERAADCGCRLAAVDDVVLVERDALGFARARSAALYRLGADSAPVALTRYAADGPEPGAGAIQLIGPSAGAEIDIAADGSIVLSSAGAPRLTGRFERIGRRRGRVAGVAALTAPDGTRFALLLGVEPAERRSAGADLLARARSLF